MGGVIKVNNLLKDINDFTGVNINLKRTCDIKIVMLC